MAEPSAAKPVQLTPRQRNILITIAETMLPSDVGFPIPPDLDNLVIPIENLFAPAGRSVLSGMGAMLLMFEYAALIFLPRFKTFTKLSPADREKYLVGWQTSRIKYRRLLMLSVKALVCLIFFSDSKVKAAVGYDPECLVETSK